MTASGVRRTAAGGLLAVAAAVAAFGLLRGTPPPGVPSPDLSRVHPRVAEKIQEAQARIRDEPRSAARWGELGMVFVAHQFRRDAGPCFAEAARLNPKEFRWPYLRAVLLEDSDLEEAVRWYRRAVEIDPERFPARVRLGNALMQLGRFDEADREFRQAARERPESPYPVMGLARAAVARGDLGDAKRLFESAAAMPNWYPRPAYVELVRLGRRTRDEEAARRAEERLRTLPETSSVEMPDPTLAEIESRDVLSRGAAIAADRAAAVGDLAAAERSYRRLYEARPDLPGASQNLASVLMRQGRAAEAVEILRDSVARFPDDVVARLRLADALWALGDVKRSSEEYRRCVRLKPDFAEAWYHLGLSLIALGDQEGSAEAFGEAVRSDPRHLQAHVALAVTLSREGHRDEAIARLEEAVKLAPGDPVPAEYLRRARESSDPLPEIDSSPVSPAGQNSAGRPSER